MISDGLPTECSVDALKALGGNATLEVIEGAGHYAFQDVPWSQLEGWLRRR